jgi:HSP20 family protein
VEVMTMAVPVRRTNGRRPVQVWEPFTTDAWDPVAEMRALTERFSQLLGRAADWPGFEPPAGTSAPLGEFEELDDAYLVRLDLPGVKREDVQVELTGRRLTVQAERKQTERKGLLRRSSTRRTGAFFFETLLPSDVDPDGVEATLEEGVLTLRLSKPESERRRRYRITVR